MKLENSDDGEKKFKNIMFLCFCFPWCIVVVFVVFDIKTEETKGEMDKSSLHLSDF